MFPESNKQADLAFAFRPPFSREDYILHPLHAILADAIQ